MGFSRPVESGGGFLFGQGPTRMTDDQFRENKNVRGIIHLLLVFLALVSVASLFLGSRAAGVIGFFSCWIIYLLDTIANYLRILANSATQPKQ